MSNWSKLSFDGVLAPLEAITSGLSKVTSAITLALTIQKTLLKTIATLMLDLLNVQALIIKAALTAIQTILDSYFKGGKIHLLIVPIQKQLPYKLESIFSAPQADDSWAMADELTEQQRSDFEEAVNRIATADQGNEGFARTVLESLDDLGDDNRPQYDDSGAIYAVMVLAGAQNIIGILDLLLAIQGILGISLKGNTLLPPAIETSPQDVRATPVASQDTPNIGVLLEWENPPPLITLSNFDGSFLRVQEIAIIRSTSDEAIMAQDWSSFFISQPAELGENDADKSNVLTSLDDQTTVIKQFKFFAARSAYVDDDKSLAKNTDYYYAVAFRYAIAPPPGTDGKTTYITQNFHKVSNVVKVRVTDTVPMTRGGVPPDWLTHPSPLDLIPDLKFYFKMIQAYVESLKVQGSGAKAAIESYIKFLEAEIERYNDFQTNVVNRIARLVKLFQLPAGGVYITTIDMASGGNDALKREIVNRLTDEADTSAPPFFRNGITAGFVILAGASNPAEIAPVKTLISLLFGGGGVATAFEDAVNSIDAALTAAEEITFGEDMQKGTPPETIPSYATFDDSLTGVPADDPSAKVPFDP